MALLWHSLWLVLVDFEYQVHQIWQNKEKKIFYSTYHIQNNQFLSSSYLKYIRDRIQDHQLINSFFNQF